MSEVSAAVPIKVTVWDEDSQELWPESVEAVRATYPDGIGTALVAALERRLAPPARVQLRTFHQPEHGLSQSTLDETDVLVWWGHLAQDALPDDAAARVRDRVLGGMGLLVLHSAWESKPFRLLMGTSCRTSGWRDIGERAVLWTVAPGHPIAAGVPASVVIPEDEMYTEYFDIPVPEELVFISSYAGGEVLRSGCCFVRGGGRIFYFSPGHESYPVYRQPEVELILANAVAWAAGGVGLRFPDPGRRERAIDWFQAS